MNDTRVTPDQPTPCGTFVSLVAAATHDSARQNHTTGRQNHTDRAPKPRHISCRDDTPADVAAVAVSTNRTAMPTIRAATTDANGEFLAAAGEFLAAAGEFLAAAGEFLAAARARCRRSWW
jgi:hypothetical protein